MTESEDQSATGAARSSAAAKVGGAVGDVAISAAASAAKGAAAGGVGGAAAGAAKGALVAAAGNRDIRRVVAIAVLAILGVLAVIGVGAAGATAAILTSVIGTAEQNTDYVIGGDKVPAETVRNAASIASKHGISRELVIAVLQANDEFDFIEFSSLITAGDPNRQMRDLRTGSVSSSGSTARTIPASGRNADAAAAIRKLHVDALTKAGFAGNTAESIYSRALNWALGDPTDPEEAACYAPITGTPAGGEAMSIAGTKFTAGQVANMRATIGVAKTMFPDAARQAAIVGLITVRQESVFRNYANDGVFNSATDPNPGGYGAADYAHLKLSLDMPHDAVGSDHASLGLLQQQATMGWGDYAGSSWAGGDYQGVITRLMTPTYTIGKFYVRVQQIKGWKDLAPGKLAQRVQVSAYPTAYSKHLTFATEAWGLLSATSPALAVPGETGWTGGTFDDGEMPVGSSCPGAPIAVDGEYVWPVEVDEQGVPLGYLTSRFGTRMLNGQPNFHSGIDLTGAGYNTGVFALAAGTVVKSHLWSAACGEYIQIAHPDGTATGYLHMVDRLVNVGDQVQAGQLIAHMGGGQSGGCTFGAHLHLYSFDPDGTRVDPEPYLKARGLIFPPERITARN